MLKKIFNVSLALVPFFIAGCGVVPPAPVSRVGQVPLPSLTPPVSTPTPGPEPVRVPGGTTDAATTQPAAAPDVPFERPESTIDMADVNTWPRFAFKEVGFSVQLPFPEDAVHTQYVKCKDGKATDADGGDLSDTDLARGCNKGDKTYYQFRALVDRPWAKTDDTSFLGHVSFDHAFMYGTGRSFFGLWSALYIGDINRKGKVYHYSYIHDGTEIPNTPLTPYRVVNRSGRKISLFDLSELTRGDNVAILVEQPRNTAFEAVVLEFWADETGISKTMVEKIAESIQF